MPKRLMTLRDVPDDEYDEIHALLDGHGLAHYRTEGSRFGISSPALWLVDDGRLAAANALLATYHDERARRARADWERARADGSAPTLGGQLRADPIRALALLFALLLAVALSLLPFLWLGGFLG